MEITERFGSQWQAWDHGLRNGLDRSHILARAADEDLVELLAGTSASERKYDRDIIATEILNRLGRRQRGLPAVAEEVLQAAEAAYLAAAEGQLAIHRAEAILKAGGEEDLGAVVSAAAYASLDTTKLAFGAAQKNSADVQATVAQSRVARRLASAAADSAAEAEEAARRAGPALRARGHDVAADAAQEAAREMAAAAEEAVEATERELDATGTQRR